MLLGRNKAAGGTGTTHKYLLLLWSQGDESGPRKSSRPRLWGQRGGQDDPPPRGSLPQGLCSGSSEPREPQQRALPGAETSARRT